MNKIKNFFTRKRCRKLKLLNQKGFSLLEVLAAVTILGIISSIAVVQYQDYKEGSAFVVAGSSSSSMLRAYQNCVAFKNHSQCGTKSAIGIDCQECSIHNSGNKFCAQYEKEIGGSTFKLCVSLDGGVSSTTAGGDFFLCKKECNGAITTGGPCENIGNAKKVMKPIKKCNQGDAQTDCDQDAGKWKYYCEKNAGSGAGTCNAGVCQ